MEMLVVTTEKFYEEVFFNVLSNGQMDGSDRDRLLMYALDANIPKLDTLLRDHACFPSSTRVLRKAEELVLRYGFLGTRKFFSPDDGRFLLESKEFRERERTAAFRRIGMLYDHLPEPLLLDRVQSIEQLQQVCSHCALERSKDVVYYLERKIVIEKLEKQTTDALSRVKFLPVHCKPREWPFEWKATSVLSKIKMCILHSKETDIKVPQKFAMACPKKLFFEECKELVGCTQLILHQKSVHTDSSDKALCFLGVQGKDKKSVDLEDVVQQLDILTSSNIDAKNILILSQTLQEAFWWLELQCRNLREEQGIQVEELFQRLNEKSVLLIKGKLWKSSEVALTFERDCFPYLAGVRQGDLYLEECQKVLKYMGVKERFSSEYITKVLACLQSTHGTEKPLKTDSLVHNCNLLGALCDALEYEKVMDGNFPALKNSKILIPDVEGVLRPASDLCLDDDTGIQRSRSMRFVCSRISPDQTRLLGIQTKKRRKTRDHLSVLNFGQKEKLTTRINRILDGYPADEGIFKELLQNADDAGASEIHFVKDFYYYPREKVFDGEYRELQGPALLVYNNRSFSEEDLEGIQNLGIGSKGEDPTKTGQYGVGFNAVYHLTDVPSFITKGPNLRRGTETLCILDPQCRYAEDADDNSPGKRYCDLDGLRDLLPDVFKPYHDRELIKDEGTVFRFPLRNYKMAQDSKIRNKSFEKETVADLLDGFKRESFHSLLFLKHVQRIVFSRVEKEKIVEEYSVNLSMSPEDRQKRHIFHGIRKKYGDQVLKKEDITAASTVDIATELRISDRDAAAVSKKDLKVQNSDTAATSVSKEESWFVVERIGFGGAKIPELVTTEYKNGNLGLLPQGGVALPLSLPKGAATNRKSKAFCFLPLPVPTGIPMHVNGHFALNHESRRNLWEDDKDSFKVLWNKTLISTVITPAYIAALEHQRDLVGEKMNVPLTKLEITDSLAGYLQFFPKLEHCADRYWKHLCSEVYSQVGDGKQLFPTTSSFTMEEFRWSHVLCEKKCSIQWIGLQGKQSECPSIFCLSEEDSISPESVSNLLKAQNMKVVDFATPLFLEMQECGQQVVSLTPDVAIQFLKSYQQPSKDSCQIHGMGDNVVKSSLRSVQCVDTLLSFCNKSDIFNQKICGLPLQVSNDGVLNVFSEEDSLYCTYYCDLLPTNNSQFISRWLVTTLKSVDSPCMKQFGLQDFADLIHYTLPGEKFRNQQVPVQWNPEANSNPNKSWILQVWDFFNSIISLDENVLCQVFRMWCLVPIKKGDAYALECLDRSKKVLNRTSFVTSRKLKMAIDRLQLPVVDKDVFIKQQIASSRTEFSSSVELLVKCVVSCSSPVEVLDCFEFHLQNSNIEILEEDCCAVLEYFNDSLTEMKESCDTTTLREKLRRLPLYLTIAGTNTCLQNSRGTVLVLPATIPQAGIQEWARNSGTILLKENSRIEELHAELELSNSDVLDLYINHIVPKFSDMPDIARLLHLEYVRDSLLNVEFQTDFEPRQKALIRTLKDHPFIEKNGQKYKASAFFSPHNEVFKIMMSKEKFPPEPFSNWEWKKFMDVIGMTKDVTAEMMVQFSKEVALEGSHRLTESTTKKSEVLVRHLITEDSLVSALASHTLCQIKDIRFIVPMKLEESHSLLELHEQYKNRHLVSFSECVPEEYAEIVWTSADILPEYCDPEHGLRQDIFGLLGVRRKPTSLQVVQNLQNVSDALKDKLDCNASSLSVRAHITISTVFTSHYQFLQRNSLHDPLLVTHLKEKPIIFLQDDKKCVMCKQVVFGLSESNVIKPYLFCAPYQYGGYIELFEKLGASREVTADHFANVLFHLNNDSKKDGEPDVLDPNTRIKVLFPAMLHLFSRAHSLKVTELYLPNRELKLQRSDSLICSDKKEYERRAEAFSSEMFFIGFEKMKLSGAFPDEWYTLNRLPKSLRPSFLSQLLDEKLLEVAVCHPEENVRCLSQFLQCEEFIAGVLRLVTDDKMKQSLESGMIQSDFHLKEEEQTAIVDRIRRIKVQQVSVLQTALFKDGEILEGSIRDRSSFVEMKMNAGNKTWILYCIKCRDTSEVWKYDIPFELMKILQKVTRGKLLHNRGLVYELVGLMSNPGEISRLLDKRDIKSVVFQQERWNEVFPEAGTYVPDCEHHLLDNSFCEFESGDYVALLLFEEEVEGGESTSNPLFIYAIVKECCGDPSNVSEIEEIARMQRIYLLEVEDQRTERYPAYKIFKFHRRTISTSTDLEPAVNLAHTPASQPIDAVMLEVQRQFLFIMELTNEEERRLLLRRLRAKWHPDNNLENRERANEVFQFLEGLIRKLKSGKLIDGQSSKTTGYRGEDIPDTFVQPAPPSPRQYRARSHAMSAYMEKMSIPRVARQWLRQAECDVRAAKEFDPHAGSVLAFNWICYQCHQVNF